VRARQSVAAVVAAASWDGDLPLAKINIHRLHCGNGDDSGILHQANDAIPIVDRPAVGH
jgi:hypothetical protein